MAKKMPRRPPAASEEGRENQLISLAMDEAERLIMNGEASSQVLTHFLKLGSTRERLEKQRLEQENRLLQAKIEHMASSERVEELYANAITAMRSYSGEPADVMEEDIGDDYY